MEQLFIRINKINIPPKLAKKRQHKITVSTTSSPIRSQDLNENKQKKGSLTCNGFFQFTIPPNLNKSEKIEINILYKGKSMAGFSLLLSNFPFRSVGRATFDLNAYSKDYKKSNASIDVHYTDGYNVPFNAPVASINSKPQKKVDVYNLPGNIRITVESNTTSFNTQGAMQYPGQIANQQPYYQYPQQQQFYQRPPIYQQPIQQYPQYQQQPQPHPQQQQPMPNYQQTAPNRPLYYQNPNVPPQYPNPELIARPQLKQTPPPQPQQPYNKPISYPPIPSYPPVNDNKAPPYNYPPQHNYGSPTPYFAPNFSPYGDNPYNHI